MRWIDVDSRSIARIGYASKRRELGIEFRDSGKIYLYFDVPPEEHTGGLGVYTARLRQSLQSEMARNRTAQTDFRAQLDQKNSQVDKLERQVQDLQDENTTLQASAESPPIVLNLQPLEREGDSVPIVKRSSKAKVLEFHVSTMDFPSPSYAVSLKDNNGKELRSWANLKAGHNLLTFRVPLRLLRAGEYSVVITGDQKSQPYPFRAE